MSHRRHALVFIFITVVLDVLAFGITIPVLPRLVEQFEGGDTARAATIIGGFGTVFALMQFLCAPVLGTLSDQVGRRPVILLSILGLGLDYLLMAFAPTLGWLWVGRVIAGITGASFSAASAYIADSTTEENRAAGFGMVGAAWGLGFVLGPALGGWLGASDPRLPFKAAAALALVNAVYGFFVLPESLPVERRERFTWQRANPFGALAFLRKYPALFGLQAVNVLYQISHDVMPAVFVLYVGYRYGMGPKEVGIALAVIGVANILVQGVLVKKLVGWAGERRALLLGLACSAIALVVYGLAPTRTLFWLGVPIGALVGLFSPALQSLMTRRVIPSEQGQLQGVNGSILGLTGMIGPGLFTYTFATFIRPDAPFILPGAPFLVAALAVGLALITAIVVTAPDATAVATTERVAES